MADDEDRRAPGRASTRVVTLGHGHEVLVRRLRQDDRPALEALFADLPMDDIRLRFFSSARPGRSLLDHWFVADDGQLGRLVALEDGDLIGDAGWYRLPNGDAEFDITVGAHHRGWLGPYLLDALVDDARTHGIRNLVAEIDRTNDRMLALVRERGMVSLGDEGPSVVRVAIGVAEGVPIWTDRVAGRPRLVVEGDAMPWGADGIARTYGADLVACQIATGHRPNHCPALAGRPCPLADGADAVIVNLAPGDERTHRLLAAHEHLHPGTARFVTGSGWCQSEGVTPLRQVDVEGIETVLRTVGAPVHLVRRRTDVDDPVVDDPVVDDPGADGVRGDRGR